MNTKLICLFLVLSLSSCQFGRFVIYNFADITDYKKFPQKPIEKAGEPFLFKDGSERYSKLVNSITLNTEKNGKLGLTEFLEEETKTVAFIVIKNDSILYEKYFEKYNEASIVTSFSVAKSFVSAMIGIAIQEGHIKSVEEPITNYITELNQEDPRFKNIKIEHVLNMRTGLKFNENSYTNPFAEIAKLYYGRNHLKQVINTKIEEDTNESYEYQSINTEILAIIIERATGKKLADYFEEKIWQPLGMEYDASWNIDSKKHETPKGYCCLNARARDFAKLGRLYLKRGNWEGNQIINEDWIDRSILPNVENGCYQYQWYSYESFKKDSQGKTMYFPDSVTAVQGISSSGQVRASVRNPGQYYIENCGPAFMAIGILGQFIYVDPEQDLVMVRFGKKSDFNYPSLFSKIGELIKKSE
ncbi:MAG: serine hydrolase [Bacteroidota bacterium]